ncbi:MAG: pseudaminic acid biosynthesis-associated methylase [Dissulfuribacterales bacterium]
MPAKTEQEEFWGGEFGREYTARNQGERLLASNTAFFAKILSRTREVRSVLELGANRGLNLMAIKCLIPEVFLSAVEINDAAVQELKGWGGAREVFHASILDFKPERLWDLVFVKGVLIHINPDFLEEVYQILYDASSKYVLIAEYYNPTPVEIPYRGHRNRLFKRDFAGEFMKKFPQIRLVDYGFVYHGDSNFPQDDITWFLMEKR